MSAAASGEQTILVTGAASGIGAAAALLLAERGARLGLLDMAAGQLRVIGERCAAAGAARVVTLTCDVRDSSEVEAAVERCTAQLGPPDGLFASAGIDVGGDFHRLDPEIWRRVLATNLDGTFNVCRAVIATMVSGHRCGSIVCASSPSAFVGLASGGAGPYAASKGGVSALVRALAIEYASAGIRVNAVVPGATDTPLMWANVAAGDRPEMERRVISEIPLGRLAAPEEPAKAVVWLLSDEASYVTGSHLVCDGGLLAKASFSV